MTLDEAIARFEMGIKQIEKELFIRSEYGNQTNDMFRRTIAERYEEHRKNQVEETKQLVEMLRELKIFREREKTITIKTLTSKPCEDAISRDQVLDEIHNCLETRDYTLGHLYDVICELPSVQPEQKWIPVSKRTPKKGEVVYFTFFTGKGPQIGITKYNPEIGFLCNAVAWMPSPKPYKPYTGNEEV